MSQGMDYEAAHAAALAKYGVSPYSVYYGSRQLLADQCVFAV
jgi:hypothetical protein